MSLAWSVVESREAEKVALFWAGAEGIHRPGVSASFPKGSMTSDSFPDAQEAAGADSWQGTASQRSGGSFSRPWAGRTDREAWGWARDCPAGRGACRPCRHRDKVWASAWAEWVCCRECPGQSRGQYHHPREMTHPNSRVSGRFQAAGLTRRPARSWGFAWEPQCESWMNQLQRNTRHSAWARAATPRRGPFPPLHPHSDSAEGPSMATRGKVVLWGAPGTGAVDGRDSARSRWRPAEFQSLTSKLSPPGLNQMSLALERARVGGAGLGFAFHLSLTSLVLLQTTGKLEASAERGPSGLFRWAQAPERKVQTVGALGVHLEQGSRETSLRKQLDLSTFTPTKLTPSNNSLKISGTSQNPPLLYP